MDYEKKYNEALERAKKWIKEHPSFLNGGQPLIMGEALLRNIFPELRESEDERIRKELVAFFIEVRNREGNEGYWHDLKVADILAYLEKQKEPHYTKRNALFDECVKNCDPEVMKRVSDEIDAQLAKEQKHVQSPNEKEYVRTLKSLIADFLRGKEEVDRVYYQQIYDWLDGRHIEQKPNWAEKEKTDFVSGQFIQCRKSFDDFKEGEHYWFEYIGDDTYVGRSDNILNQKFHITPRQLYTLFSQQLDVNEKEQKPVEWSEEDEMGYMDLMRCIEVARKSAKDENDMGNAWYAEHWLKTRLKSLRPQPHWKPSGEQLVTLLRAEGIVRVHDTKELAAALAQLYEQLKKL